MKDKEPSLLRQIVAIHYEQAKRRKALRILSKQEWSVEFLEYLVLHAAKDLKQHIIISVTSPGGHKFEIKSVDSETKLDNDYDIFNHIDDDVAVNKFIRDHNTRG